MRNAETILGVICERGTKGLPLERVYRQRDKLTRDVGGKAGTSQFADSIIEAMEAEAMPEETAEPTRA